MGRRGRLSSSVRLLVLVVGSLGIITPTPNNRNHTNNHTNSNNIHPTPNNNNSSSSTSANPPHQASL